MIYGKTYVSFQRNPTKIPRLWVRAYRPVYWLWRRLGCGWIRSSAPVPWDRGSGWIGWESDQ